RSITMETKDIPVPELLRRSLRLTLEDWGIDDPDSVLARIGARVVDELTVEHDDVIKIELKPLQLVLVYENDFFDGEPRLLPIPPGYIMAKAFAMNDDAKAEHIGLRQIQLTLDGNLVEKADELL